MSDLFVALCSFVLTIKGIDEEGAKEKAKGIVMD